jgi:hypothetical protein
MMNFYEEGKVMPFWGISSFYKVKSKSRLYSSKMKELALDSLTTNDRECYAKYLASLINEYQLRSKYAAKGQEQETIASKRHAKMRNVKEKVKRKIDKILLINLSPVDYSYNLATICLLLFFSVIGIQHLEGKEVVVNGDIKEFEYQDTLKSKIQNGNNPKLAIANMLQQKKEYRINHDFKKAIVAHGNGVESEAVLFQSLLTRYQKGYKSQTMRPGQAFVDDKLSVNNGNLYRLGCYNVNLRTLYREAFLNDKLIFSHNRILLEVNDVDKLAADYKGKKYVQWLEKNGYCYELIMPVAVGKAAVYKQMQNDLAKMFPQYKASIEKRKIECYALVRTSKQDKLKTKGGQPGGSWDYFGFAMQNYYGLSYFLQQLEFYLQNELPIIDNTGYNGKIDIDIKANLSNIEELNNALAAYDLKFVREFHEINVLVISDSGLEPVEFSLNPVDYADMPRNFDWLPLKKGEISR